jgi:hypothetical protein
MGVGPRVLAPVPAMDFPITDLMDEGHATSGSRLAPP